MYESRCCFVASDYSRTCISTTIDVIELDNAKLDSPSFCDLECELAGDRCVAYNTHPFIFEIRARTQLQNYVIPISHDIAKSLSSSHYIVIFATFARVTYLYASRIHQSAISFTTISQKRLGTLKNSDIGFSMIVNADDIRRKDGVREMKKNRDADAL